MENKNENGCFQQTLGCLLMIVIAAIFLFLAFCQLIAGDRLDGPSHTENTYKNIPSDHIICNRTLTSYRPFSATS